MEKEKTGDMLISLIVPCYNEEEAMPLFYQEACRVAKNMKESHNADFEIIFVDDGSKDGTLHTARKLHRQDDRVRYISFSRNFGKEAGIYAITGETGAGKSIILGAIGLLLGNRADSKAIKAGRDRCVIEAHFDLSSTWRVLPIAR